jgi:3-deoxy-D-manno-octulosonic-acid transferase
MFFLYQLIILIIIILSPLIIIYRIIKKKENIFRFKEKFCIFSKKRVVGNVLWFHGSSVGELLSILPLVLELEKKKSISQILITSSTLSSAEIFKKFKFKKTIHQFFPIDSIILSYRFLNYWKPTIAIFIESEIWPSIFRVLNKKKIPLALLNARITNKTFKRWDYFKKFSKSIFKNISVAYPQNLETKKYLKKLGISKIKHLGNLKFIENKQSNLIKLNNVLIKNFKNKKIWCASSTHLNEELICSKVHINLKKKYKNLLTIIIPRHVNRVPEIIQQIKDLKLTVTTHSSNPKNLNNVDIYLVDTYGETKKFYQVSRVVFMGGSLIKRGGQNPLESTTFGSTILHGPNIDNFTDIYKLLDQLKISYKINGLTSLTSLINKFINSTNSNKNYLMIDRIGQKILKKTTVEFNNLLNNEIKKT